MSNYFRITGYHKEKDFSFIMDCNGAYDKLWQFSSYLVKQGFEVVEVGDSDKFLDGNIRRMDVDHEKMGYWCIASGRPIYKTIDIDGVSYQAVQVDNLYYVPDRTRKA